MVSVLTDGDACPVKDEIAALKTAYCFDWWIFIDVSHVLEGLDAHIVYCDKQKDSADMALVNQAAAGDIVVTSDLGLAALALAKGCQVIDFDGRYISEARIDSLLFERYAHQKMRRKKLKVQSKKARTSQDNNRFYQALKNLLEASHETA